MEPMEIADRIREPADEGTLADDQFRWKGC